MTPSIDVQPTSCELTSLCVPELLRSWAIRTPDAAAIIAPHRLPLSYGQLWRECQTVGATLHRLGIRSGDRVAVVLPNGPEMALAFLAVASVATCAPLNPRLREVEFSSALSDLRVTAVIVRAGARSSAADAATSLGVQVIELSANVGAAAGILTLDGPDRAPNGDSRLAQPDDVALVLQTSGTTSRPKRVPLTHSNICRSATSIQRALALRPADRCLNIMPLFHIHGLIGALLSSLAGGGSVVCTPDFYAPEFFSWLREFAPTWYTAVPSMHQAILARSAAVPRPIETHLRFVRSCSAALPARLMTELEELFGVPVIEAYGMTEAAHEIASNPLPPASRKPGSVGVATGAHIVILDGSGIELPGGETGEIAIRGDSVTCGYEQNPDANLAAFSNGWLRTGDQGYQDQDGYLFIAGRLKEMINRGGEKVWPTEIDAVLLNHPSVAQAVSFAIPDARLGEEVGAAIVLRAHATANERDILDFAAQRLADFKLPRHLVIVDEIPKGPTGKIQRTGLAKALGLWREGELRGSRQFVAARTAVERSLVDIWQQVLKYEPIGVADHFLDLGGDSILATLVLSRIRDRLHVDLQPRDLFESGTIGNLAAAITRSAASVESTEASESPTGLEEAGLSSSEQRLWFLHNWQPSTPLYNRPVLFELRGVLDEGALRQALDEIVRRHEILRTTFPAANGKPARQVAATLDVPISRIDFRSVAADDERRQLAESELASVSQQVFDLETGPLIRATLAAVDDEVNLLLLVFHHIVFDAWSAEILFREFAALYASFSQQSRSPLAELPAQYRDFARWEHHRLRQPFIEAQLAYWQAQLRDCPPALDLPTDRLRSTPGFAGGCETIVLDDKLGARLRAMSRRENVTLFIALLAAFKVLLHRYTGSADIAVGCPVTRRSHQLSEQLIGCFINTLVLRTRLTGNPTVRELLDRVRQTALDAYSHAELPFDKLVAKLAPIRNANRNPFFNVMFGLEAVEQETARSGGLTIRQLPSDTAVAKFDLVLEVTERQGELTCVVTYKTELFDATTIQRLLCQYRTVLEAMAVSPEISLSTIPLMSADERHQVVVEWNATRRAYPRQSLCTRFEDQVRRTPDLMALSSGGRQLTYGELNRRANQLAHYLRATGLQRGDFAGVAVDRSLDSIIALLAILKAGGAYLPLDTTFPRERLALMIADARPRIVVTELQHATALTGSDTRLICLDRDRPALSSQPESTPTLTGDADDVACVMYTSGSAGRPKGVCITHRNIERLLIDVDYARLDATTCTLHLAPLAFDASTFEIWGPLLHGGRVAVAPSAVPSLEGLERLLRRECVNTLWLTASFFNTVIDERPQALQGLRELLIGGEALSMPHVVRALAALPSTQIVNGYGPTEATTFTCCYAVPRSLDPLRRSVPLGRPIAGTRVYVLDQHLQPTAIGVAGELYIGGDGVAAGYLNHETLTAEKFVSDPFSADPHARLFRSGDLARWLADGTLEFLGRLDDQIKLRGFRIEPGDIEATLAAHPSVRQTAVILRDDGPDHKYLAAYVVPCPGTVLEPAEVQRFLASRLPTFMIPASVVLLNHLPVTSTGKLDRQALPRPDRASAVRAAAPKPPETSEKALASIWADVLGVEFVGTEDNFFSLGGHSLLVLKLASRIAREFGVELPIGQVFDCPTLAAMAEKIDAASVYTNHETTGATRSGRSARGALSFAQARLWFLDQLRPNSSLYNIPRAFRLSGRLDRAALERALNTLIERHETLRTIVTVEDEGPIGTVLPSTPRELPFDDLSGLDETTCDSELHERLVAEARRPFILAHDPPIRFALIRVAPDDHVLLVTFHHIASDAWSLDVFNRELSHLYDALAKGQPPALPPLPLDYADFVRMQRDALQGQGEEQELAFWRSQLADATFIELPYDRALSTTSDFRGNRQSLKIDGALHKALTALARREGATLFMTVLAAFNVLLSRLTGHDDILVGLPIAGRTGAQTEGLIGLFVDTLPLRVRLDGHPTFADVLARVRQATLEAHAHQILPFERIVEALNVPRDVNRNPLFEILVNGIAGDIDTLSLTGLTVETVRRVEPESKFAITLYVVQDHDQLRIDLVYRRALYRPDRIAAVLDQFRYLLEQIVATPEKFIQQFSLVTPTARALLPDPSLALPTPRHELVMDMFAACVASAPHATALRQEGRSWTYAELAQRVEDLERVLSSHGVNRGDVVAVIGQRTFGVIVGALAVFARGAVLLTIDPLLPAARRQLMIEQAGARWIVRVGKTRVDDGWMERVTTRGIIAVDEGTARGVASDAGHEQTPAPVEPDNAAYIFFTSGSSGVPKAVLGTHKGLSHFLDWQRTTFDVRPSDRCAQLTALSFDVVLRDIFLPLTSGATLCLPSETDEASSSAILEWLDRDEVTLLHAVPSRVQEWLCHVPSRVSLRTLRWLFMSGEPLTDALVQRWRRAFPMAGQIVNLYGPTETTLIKTFFVVPADPQPGVQPVGRPLPETQALVLTPQRQLCGIGEPGEIALRTPFRTRGYVNTNGEPDTRFALNPFRADKDDIIYYTGDRGRYRTDGSLDFLGRLDDQVKIRGVRIEPREVSAVLSRHPSVAAAAVVAGRNEEGDTSLTAYVVASGAPVETAALRAHLAAQLPPAFIPETFVRMETLPLLPNGKLDVRALPPPARRSPVQDATVATPNGPVEEALAAIWREVLRRPQVGRHDDFFDLGGHSLLATQMFNRVRDHLKVDMPLRKLFEAPTIAELARAVVEAQGSSSGASFAAQPRLVRQSRPPAPAR